MIDVIARTWARRRQQLHFVVLICTAHFVGAPVALADPNPIPAKCANATRPYNDPIYEEKTNFDRKRQKGWYWRWWTGKCDRVPYPDRWTCVSANEEETAWASFIETIKATPETKSKVHRELCQLGELIGLEWSRDNDVRCIHTSDLAKLRATIVQGETQPLGAIQTVRAQVKEKLACRKN
jgi:hypothetical protein